MSYGTSCVLLLPALFFPTALAHERTRKAVEVVIAPGCKSEGQALREVDSRDKV